MIRKSTKSSATPKKWDEVLAKVCSTLDDTLAKTDERLRELDELLSTKQNDQLARHLEGLEQHRQRAATMVEQTDQAIASGEKLVREYMSSADGLRKKMMGW